MPNETFFELSVVGFCHRIHCFREYRPGNSHVTGFRPHPDSYRRCDIGEVSQIGLVGTSYGPSIGNFVVGYNVENVT
jgi:hypothetical protein